MRRRYLALGAAVVLLLGGCSSGHHSAAPPSTTTIPSGPNPDVVPAVITPAYVNAVFKVLNHINGDAVRALVDANAMTPEVTSRLRAVYGDPLYGIEVEVFRTGLSQDVKNLRRPPGDRITTVQSLISAGPTCVFARTVSSLSAVELHPTATAAAEYWELQRKVEANDPQHLNPTPWDLTYNQDFQSPTTVPNQC